MRKLSKVFIALAMFFVSLGFTGETVYAEEVLEDTTRTSRSDHLVLDVGFQNNLNDKSQYQTHGQGVGDLSYEDGVIGRALRINNGDKGSYDEVQAIQYVDFGVADQLQFKDGNHSFSFWLNSKAGAGNGAALISNKNFKSGSNRGYTVGLFDTGMRYNFKTDAAARSDVNTYAPKEVLETGWHHYTISVNRASDYVIYRDGERVGSKTISQHGTSTIDTDLPFVLGASGIYNNGIIDALVDELKVYDTNLTAVDAKELYLEGDVHLAYTSASTTLSEHGYKSEMDPELFKKLEGYITELQGLLMGIDHTDVETVETLLKNTRDAQEEMENYNPGVEPEDNLVLHLEFEDDATDSSTYQNDATVVTDGSGSITYEEGVKGKAIHIQSPNGSVESNAGGEASEYLILPKSESLDFKENSFSIALWVKQPYQITGNANVLVSNKNYYSGSNQGYAMAMFKNGLTVNAKAEGGVRKDTKRYNQIFDKSWHFIVSEVNRDTNQMKLFYDNKLIETVDISGFTGSMHPTAYSWMIGASGTASNGISDTLLDEVRFYKGAISEELRKELFEEFDMEAEFLRQYHGIKAEVQETIDAGLASQSRIDEINRGFAYVDEQLTKDYDSHRLLRDLSNMLDRFYDTNEPNFTFNVVTDTHIDLGDGEPENYDNYLQDVRWLNPNSKVMMNSGDFTTNAKVSEYKQHYEILEKNQLPDRQFLTALGNHDVRWLCSPRNSESNTNREVPTCPEDHPNANLWKDRYLEYNAPYMGDDWNGDDVFHKMWVDGYLFIVINTEADLKDWAYISDRQIAWLDETMKESDPNKPVFIAMHQVLEGTAEYIQGDLIGGQDEQLKEVLSKYGNAVMFTGHIHSSADRAKVHTGEWGRLMDMASYSYVYTSGGDRRNQISYQVEVYDDEIVIRVRDHASGDWIDAYEQRFSMSDELPLNPRETAFDIPTESLTVTSPTAAWNQPIENIIDNDSKTVWTSDTTDREDLWINFHLEEETSVAGVRYLTPKEDGKIKTYQVWISTDHGDTYSLRESSQFEDTDRWQYHEFDAPLIATDIKIKVITNTGSGVVAKVSEMRLLGSTMTQKQEDVKVLEKRFDDLNESYYEEASYEALRESLELAKNAQKPGLLVEAIQAVEAAFDALVLKPIEGIEETYDFVYGDEIEITLNFDGVFETDPSILKVTKKDDLRSSGTGVTYILKAVETGRVTLKFKSEHNLDKEIEVNVAMDTTELDAVIATIKETDESLYTPKSYAPLKDVLESVPSFVRSAKQADVEGFIEKLHKASEHLILVSEAAQSTTAIKTLLQEARTKDYTKYTKSSVNALKTAITNAETLLSKDLELITQQDVDDHALALKDALEALVEIPEDISEKLADLKALIATAKGYNLTLYTEVSQTSLKAALASAKALLEDESGLTEALLDSEIAALQKAINDLVLIDSKTVDTSELVALINKYKTVDLSKYSTETVTVFKEALAKAEALIEKSKTNSSSVSQKEVDDMAKELSTAYQGLKAKSTEQDKKVPTGINDYSRQLLLVMSLAVGAMVILRKRKRA